MNHPPFAITLLDFRFSSVWQGDISADPDYVTDGNLIFCMPVDAARVLPPRHIDMSMMIPGTQTAALVKELVGQTRTSAKIKSYDAAKQRVEVVGAGDLRRYWFDADYLKIALWAIEKSTLTLTATGWLCIANSAGNVAFLLRANP